MKEEAAGIAHAALDGGAAAPAAAPSEFPPPLHAPIDVRNTSLAVLAVLASLLFLHWASAVFVPLLLGVTASYALTPVVNRMVRLHIPRALAAATLLLGLLGGIASMGWSLADDAASLIESLPEVAQKLRRGIALQRSLGSTAALDKVQKAASELESAGEEGSASATARNVTKVQIEPRKFNVKDYLWSGTMGLVGAAGQASIVLFVAFFLLAAGDAFRRKVVRIAGPTFSRKRLTLQALDEIDLQIQRYLLVQVFSGVVVGVATWLALLWIGLEHAGVWGAAAFLLNFIPYFGSVVLTATSTAIGFVQFGSLEMALLIAGATLLIHIVTGYVLTPWLTGRASRMNPVVVFVGVLAWGWLWGLWGLFLGMPILMAIKAVCDRVDEFKPVGELLGD